MAKSSNNNIAKKPPSNLPIDQYRDIFTYRQQPVSEAFIYRFAEELVKWAIEDDGALRLNKFIRSKRVDPSSFYDWCKKHPVLLHAKRIALQAIGDRREEGALKKKYDGNVMMKQQYLYDKEWWDSEVKRAELRARTQHGNDSDVEYNIFLDGYKEDDKKKTDNMPEEK